jgi:hypothetical protein
MLLRAPGYFVSRQEQRQRFERQAPRRRTTDGTWIVSERIPRRRPRTRIRLPQDGARGLRSDRKNTRGQSAVSLDTLRGYVRDAELFKDHAGTGLL